MKQILIILTIILSINLVFAMNGTGTINLSESNFTANWSIGSFNFTGSPMFIAGNLNTTGFLTFEERECENITGDFVIRNIYIGTEKNESNKSILDEVTYITYYEGDFFKHPEFNITEGYISGGYGYYEKLDFFEDRDCKKSYIGMRAEWKITERKWWFDKKELIFNPMMIYSCKEQLNHVRYCD